MLKFRFQIGAKYLAPGIEDRLFKGKYTSMLPSLCVFYFQLNYQGRGIFYQAKGGVHGLKWVYDGTAWDVESGISVRDKYYKSKQGAIQHAVKKLIDILKDKGLVS